MLVRTYVKRQRMEASLRHATPPTVPPSFELVPWDDDLLSAHAEVKWLCFQQTLDATIFPNLGSFEGCQRLMRTIAVHPQFVPESSWLIRAADGYCGCIQGIDDGRRTGMIQNIGVLPDCRGLGLGRALLAASMFGFRQVGLSVAQLEVCARNTAAVCLYHSAGFSVRKTLYREAQAEFSEYAI